jgi:NitT/TauT family transport system permease protein
MEGVGIMADLQQTFYKKAHQNKIKIMLARIILFIGILIIWEVTTRLHIIDAFIFSSPSRIIKTFISMLKNGEILYHTSVTLLETLISFALIVVLGISIAVILWLNKTLSAVVEPFLIVLNSLPKSALAPMLIVWLGNNQKAIIVTAISVAVFGTIINIYTGFMETDPEQIKLIRTLGGTKKHILLKLILPNSIKIILSNMKVSIGLALVGVIIGEFLAARSGLGYLIIYGSQIFKMDWVALSIVILCIISMILFKIIDMIYKKFF